MTSDANLQANRERIGKMLKMRMVELDMTQADVAQQAGVTQPCVCNVMRGSFSVGLDQLYKIATALQLNIDLKAN